MALRQHSPLRVSHDTSVTYEAKRNQNMTLKKVIKKKSPDMGLEPMTLRLKVWCSTDWANRAAHNSLALMKMSIYHC